MAPNIFESRIDSKESNFKCSYNVATLKIDVWPAGKEMAFLCLDEDNIDHLASHQVQPTEAEQVFFNRYVITPNKKKHGPRRYRIDGKTDDGRSLRIIFEDLGSNLARVITGWEL